MNSVLLAKNWVSGLFIFNLIKTYVETIIYNFDMRGGGSSPGIGRSWRGGT